MSIPETESAYKPIIYGQQTPNVSGQKEPSTTAYMVLCVRDDEKAIGVVRLLWDGGYIAFLSDVIVASDYQGQGIGTKLDNM